MVGSPKYYILGACVGFIMLLFFKEPGFSRSLGSLRYTAGSDPVRDARIEHEEEEASYQNAIRWQPAESFREAGVRETN